MRNEPVFPVRALERVAEGMTVVDADGRPLGTVSRLHMGDPEAITTEGNEPRQALSEAWTSPRIDRPELDDTLRRAGFLELEGEGLDDASRVIPGDRVAEVSGDIVRLHPSPAAVGAASVSAPSRPSAPVTQAAWSTTPPLDRAPEAHEANRPRPMLLAAAAMVVVAGLAAAGTFYIRWRRDQARPVNRVRRAASQVSDQPGALAALGALLLVLFASTRRGQGHEQDESDQD